MRKHSPAFLFLKLSAWVVRCDSSYASAELSYRQSPECDEAVMFHTDEYRAEYREDGVVSRRVDDDKGFARPPE